MLQLRAQKGFGERAPLPCVIVEQQLLVNLADAAGVRH
jgi:hypothetical protein